MNRFFVANNRIILYGGVKKKGILIHPFPRLVIEGPAKSGKRCVPAARCLSGCGIGLFHI
jgi:hypothetical protein